MYFGVVSAPYREAEKIPAPLMDIKAAWTDEQVETRPQVADIVRYNSSRVFFDLGHRHSTCRSEAKASGWSVNVWGLGQLIFNAERIALTTTASHGA
ncbi:hypothetical protein [Blastochloris tepida]|uniref:Uncharacterized protein n=1 Tax=Blastochloris tepida TaxID=2233851 RepID=A0A348FXM8_9HYPH|nr:hypothetical protein [Blastochloris tepida]BBF92061.1 hypothetical protein BLTE_07460 [Blastochloris tepida]